MNPITLGDCERDTTQKNFRPFGMALSAWLVCCNSSCSVNASWISEMAEPSRLVVLVIHWKMSVKSQVFSLLKFGQWFLKYSSLVFLTRWESQPNASWQLLINILWRGIISHHFELGGPLGVALDVALLRGVMSIGSGEWCHCLGLGEGPGVKEEKSPGWAFVGRGMLLGGCWKDEMSVCVPVILDRKLAAHHRIWEDWIPGWLGRQRESWVDLYSPLQ